MGTSYRIKPVIPAHEILRRKNPSYFPRTTKKDFAELSKFLEAIAINYDELKQNRYITIGIGLERKTSGVQTTYTRLAKVEGHKKTIEYEENPPRIYNNKEDKDKPTPNQDIEEFTKEIITTLKSQYKINNLEIKLL